jgi:hypothetical protein
VASRGAYFFVLAFFERSRADHAPGPTTEEDAGEESDTGTDQDHGPERLTTTRERDHDEPHPEDRAHGHSDEDTDQDRTQERRLGRDLRGVGTGVA